MAKFTVDTHLFPELGALLVGRDSTALNELVKNAYDADASLVVVHGEKLDTDEGFILVADNGIGMTPEVFETGFLRIASRSKTTGDRRSEIFKRRYTGHKGIGRLAAHKLASYVSITSTPNPNVFDPPHNSLRASIDWNEIEKFDSMDETDRGIWLQAVPHNAENPGTSIELKKLRQRWNASMLSRFVGEVHSFEAPDFLVNSLPSTVSSRQLLFDVPLMRDSTSADPGFEVKLSGDFDVGDELWQDLAEKCQWVIEIDAQRDSGNVEYAIGPTSSEATKNPAAQAERWTHPHPDPEDGPFFSARIFVRSTRRVPGPIQSFARGAAGIRLFMEGFRVLPYGERGDDWLRLDADYTRRREPFELDGLEGESLLNPIEDETLLRLANSSYYGGVFLTDAGSPKLKMLVNREGFVPGESFSNLERLVRRGVDLSVRLRAAVQERTRAGNLKRSADPVKADDTKEMLEEAKAAVSRIRVQVKEPRADTSGLDHDLIQVTEAVNVAQRLILDAQSEQDILRVAASVGTQLAAFMHEMNSLLGQARTIDSATQKISSQREIPQSLRKSFGTLRAATSSLVEQLERHVSFLTDVMGTNARRRRRRLSVLEQVEIALRLLSSRIERRNQSIRTSIAPELRTPPMFASEVLSIMVNLLSNAVKAARDDGRIEISAANDRRSMVLNVSNTGEAVDLTEAERWFRPFESTTTDVDEVLGQGMGLGLPIVRRMLEEYGGTVHFKPSSPPYSTTIEVRVPITSQ